MWRHFSSQSIEELKREIKRSVKSTIFLNNNLSPNIDSVLIASCLPEIDIVYAANQLKSTIGGAEKQTTFDINTTISNLQKTIKAEETTLQSTHNSEIIQEFEGWQNDSLKAFIKAYWTKEVDKQVCAHILEKLKGQVNKYDEYIVQLENSTQREAPGIPPIVCSPTISEGKKLRDELPSRIKDKDAKYKQKIYTLQFNLQTPPLLFFIKHMKNKGFQNNWSIVLKAMLIMIGSLQMVFIAVGAIGTLVSLFFGAGMFASAFGDSPSAASALTGVFGWGWLAFPALAVAGWAGNSLLQYVKESIVDKIYNLELDNDLKNWNDKENTPFANALMYARSLALFSNDKNSWFNWIGIKLYSYNEIAAVNSLMERINQYAATPHKTSGETPPNDTQPAVKPPVEPQVPRNTSLSIFNSSNASNASNASEDKLLSPRGLRDRHLF